MRLKADKLNFKGKQDCFRKKMKENKEFLTEQIITYIGNKRGFLDFIGQTIKRIKKELKKDKMKFFVGFLTKIFTI